MEGMMTRGTYSHLRDELLDYYTRRGSAVEVDPPGRGAPDILGKWADGNSLVGEIKSAKEAKSSASSWWNYWTKPERDLRPLYRQEPPSHPSSLRGWCAVIDGQLREYCERASVIRGELVVEDSATHRGDIEKALTFLKAESRILSWQHNASGSLDCWTIRYAALP